MDKDPKNIQEVPEERLYVGGHWLEGQEWYEVADKLDGNVLSLVPKCDDELFEMAVLAARDSTPVLSKLSSTDRASLLRRWADMILTHADEIAGSIYRETALPNDWAESEVRQAVDALRQAAVEAERLRSESRSISTDHDDSPTVDFSLKNPVGTVAVLLPNRHGFFFAVQLVGAALAAACPALIKPGILAPLAVKRFVELGAQLGWPPGSINLIYGPNSETGKQLAADPRVALLVLAGNAREREMLVAARAGRPFVSVGVGYGAAILDRTADISQVVDQLLTLRFRNPVIGAPVPYFVVVPKELTKRFRDSLAAALNSLKTAALSEDGCDIPGQINDSMAQRGENWLANITQAGGILFYGGQRRGSYIEPAIVLPPAGQRTIPPPPAEAPVFVIEAYDRRPGQALERIPDLQQAYVFTSELDAALEIARQPEVPRVDVFTARSGREPQTRRIQDTDGVRRAMSQMTRHKWIEVHLAKQD